jgi:hypothetical protein
MPPAEPDCGEKTVKLAGLRWRYLPILCVVTLLLSTVGTLPAQGERVNFARFQRVIASSQNGTFAPDLAINGLVSNFHSWRTANVTTPHWLEIQFPRPIPLGSAQVFPGIDDQPNRGFQNFVLQYFDGTEWVDIPGTQVTSNTAMEVSLPFASPIVADRVRIWSNDNGNRILREIAFYPPNPAGHVEQGFPLGTDVNLSLTFQRPAVASSTNGTNFAWHAVDGHVDDSSRWFAIGGVPDQTLEIDLLENHLIGSAHVYTGDGANSNPLAQFVLEYWNGNEWLPIPGGTITGNTQLARIVAFTEAVSTNRIRLRTTNNSFGRVRQITVFPPRPGGWPIGQDVVFRPPHRIAWDHFSDSSWRFVNQGVDLRLAVNANGNVIFGNGAIDTVEGIKWYVLLNHRDGSYRLIHPRNGLALALGEISTAPGVELILEPYSGLPHQDWFIEYFAEDPRDFRFVNAYSGLVIQSLNNATTYGASMVVVPAEDENPLQIWRRNAPLPYPKKGLAATGAQMENFFNLFPGTSWSYSWGRQRSDAFPFLPFTHAFSPTQWGNFNFAHGTSQGPIETIHNDLSRSGKPTYLVAFNEPDSVNQSNMTVATAISRWQRLMALGVPLVSPSAAGTFNGWMDDFYAEVEARGYRVDYTAVHWYSSPSATNLINHLEQAFTRWGRPVWLKEFSVVRWTGTSTWTEADNFHFLAEFLWRAESLSWLKRYSLFNFTNGLNEFPNQSAPDPTEAPRSNSINLDGTLTPFGELYAAWDGVTSVQNHRAYHIINREFFRRLHNPAAGNTLTTESPDDSSLPGLQWAIVPGLTANTVRIISTRDGRPLRFFDGGTVSLGSLGQENTVVEWRITPHQHGLYFILHPLTNQRLRKNGDGSFSMVSATNNGPGTQWRFIPALNPEFAGPAAAPAAVSGNGSSSRRIHLSWTPRDGDLTYEIQRAPADAETWEILISNLAEPEWVDDASLTPETTYRYRVITRNTLGLTSPPSAAFTVRTLHPLATFAEWRDDRLQNLPAELQTMEADPDGDGIPNLLEFAFLRNPTTPGPNPVRAGSGSAGTVTLTFPWNHRAENLTWQIRQGTDLRDRANWLIIEPESVSTTPQGDINLLEITLPAANTPANFFSVEVVVP